MNPTDERADARKALFASILLTGAAFYGVASGVADWAGGVEIEGTNELLDVAGAREALERIEEYPKRAAIGASNVLVSALLLVASVMITLRRPSAIWLVRQAVAANLVFLLVRAGARLVHVWELGDAIVPLAEAAVRARGGVPDEIGGASDMLSLARVVNVMREIVRGILVGVVHVYIGYRATRPPVRRFVGEEEIGEREA